MMGKVKNISRYIVIAGFAAAVLTSGYHIFMCIVNFFMLGEHTHDSGFFGISIYSIARFNQIAGRFVRVVQIGILLLPIGLSFKVLKDETRAEKRKKFAKASIAFVAAYFLIYIIYYVYMNTRYFGLVAIYPESYSFFYQIGVGVSAVREICFWLPLLFAGLSLEKRDGAVWLRRVLIFSSVFAVYSLIWHFNIPNKLLSSLIIENNLDAYLAWVRYFLIPMGILINAFYIVLAVLVLKFLISVGERDS